MNGVLIVNKEQDFTSHDVVAKLRGITRQKKIGHTGTLDPMATGVLPVCFGNATKLCDMLTDKSKEYETCMLLGVTTDTQDITGSVLEEKEVKCTEEEISDVIQKFVGEYEQMPPMYSALKVNGKKLYELARAGIEVERKTRTVVIEKIEILSIDLPRVYLRVGCSKGTYIRTLCDDIGRELGCGATMEELKRTRVGGFTIENAYTLNQIENMMQEGVLENELLRTDEVFKEYDKISAVTNEVDKFLHNGNPVYISNFERNTYDGELVRMYDLSEEFVGVYICDISKKSYRPFKMFL